jgi:hypothetical protein
MLQRRQRANQSTFSMLYARRPTKPSIPSASTFQLSAKFLSSSSARLRYIVKQGPRTVWKVGLSWSAFLQGLGSGWRAAIVIYSRYSRHGGDEAVAVELIIDVRCVPKRAPPRIRIQDPDCWHLEIDSDIVLKDRQLFIAYSLRLAQVVSGMSGEGGARESFHRLSYPEQCSARPARVVFFPTLCWSWINEAVGLCEALLHTMWWDAVHRPQAVNIRKSHVTTNDAEHVLPVSSMQASNNLPPIVQFNVVRSCTHL